MVSTLSFGLRSAVNVAPCVDVSSFGGAISALFIVHSTSSDRSDNLWLLFDSDAASQFCVKITSLLIIESSAFHWTPPVVFGVVRGTHAPDDRRVPATALQEIMNLCDANPTKQTESVVNVMKVSWKFSLAFHLLVVIRVNFKDENVLELFHVF